MVVCFCYHFYTILIHHFDKSLNMIYLKEVEEVHDCQGVGDTDYSGVGVEQESF